MCGCLSLCAQSKYFLSLGYLALRERCVSHLRTTRVGTAYRCFILLPRRFTSTSLLMLSSLRFTHLLGINLFTGEHGRDRFSLSAKYFNLAHSYQLDSTQSLTKFNSNCFNWKREKARYCNIQFNFF